MLRCIVTLLLLFALAPVWAVDAPATCGATLFTVLTPDLVVIKATYSRPVDSINLRRNTVTVTKRIEIPWLSSEFYFLTALSSGINVFNCSGEHLTVISTSEVWIIK